MDEDLDAEYDPAVPNDYSKRERERAEERLERLRKEALLRQLELSERMRSTQAQQARESLLQAVEHTSLPPARVPTPGTVVGRGRLMAVPSWLQAQQAHPASQPPSFPPKKDY